MSTTISSILKIKQTGKATQHELFAIPCFMGIEVELEGMTSLPESVKLWSIKSDGSLRNNGVEFVSVKPLAGKELVQAIDEFREIISVFPSSSSHRCSVHCHIDFSKNTVEETRKFYKLYTLLEPSLYTVSSKTRYHNIYCPGLTHATEQIRLAALALYSDESFAVEAKRCNKYSGINLASLNTFGTIEIRTHSGTRDANEILEWCRILNCVKAAALSLPEEVIDDLRSPEGVLQAVYSSYPDLLTTMGSENLYRYWKSAQLNLDYFNAIHNYLRMYAPLRSEDRKFDRELFLRAIG